MATRTERQLLALAVTCAVLAVGLSALVAWILETPAVSIRIVSQRDIDDTVAELVRQAREDYARGLE